MFSFMNQTNTTASPLADYVHSFTIVQDTFWNHIILFFIVLLILAIISKIIIFVTEKIILRMTKYTKTNIDDLLVERLNNPVFLLFILFGLYVSLTTIINSQSVLAFISKVLWTVSFFIFAIIAIRVLDILVTNWARNFAKKTKSEMDDSLIDLIHKFLIVIFYIIALLITLSLWGVNLGPYLASLGIAGIAIGLAFQPTLSNIFGGIQIILDKAYKVGDRIKLESSEVGHIIDVGLRSTRIETLDGDLLIIPNGVMANAKIYNYTLPSEKRKGTVRFGVEYGCDIEKVKELAIKSAKKNKNILKDEEPIIFFEGFGDSSLNFVLFFWVADYRQVFMNEDIIRMNIYKDLNKSKIGIPFPTRTVYLKKE